MLLNVDVPDIDAGVAFYAAALDLTLGRRFDDDFVELLGGRRRYERHWSPIHPRLRGR